MKRHKERLATQNGGSKEVALPEEPGQLGFDPHHLLTKEQMRTYLVEVKRQGTRITAHNVSAPDALAAINLVEDLYGGPIWIETSYIQDEHGDQHPVLLPGHWRGYTFQARALTLSRHMNQEESVNHRHRQGSEIWGDLEAVGVGYIYTED